MAILKKKRTPHTTWVSEKVPLMRELLKEAIKLAIPGQEADFMFIGAGQRGVMTVLVSVWSIQKPRWGYETFVLPRFEIHYDETQSMSRAACIKLWEDRVRSVIDILPQHVDPDAAVKTEAPARID